jgi:hypothetical protein
MKMLEKPFGFFSLQVGPLHNPERMWRVVPGHPFARIPVVPEILTEHVGKTITLVMASFIGHPCTDGVPGTLSSPLVLKLTSRFTNIVRFTRVRFLIVGEDHPTLRALFPVPSIAPHPDAEVTV